MIVGIDSTCELFYCHFSLKQYLISEFTERERIENMKENKNTPTGLKRILKLTG